MADIQVPARAVPVPAHLSMQAQVLLAMAAELGAEPVPYPARDDAAAWRALVAESDAQALGLIEGVSSQYEVTSDRRDVAGIAVDVVDPAGSEADDRVLLDIHGGALIFMGGAVCTALTRMFAGRYRMRTWGPDYRMPPDHPYPAALDDCIAVYRALVEEVGADRVVVSGTSAGGNLAAALVARARDESLPIPAALVLNTPEVDLTESGDTFHTNLGVDSVLRRLTEVNELSADGHDLAHPYLSPLFADLTGFPPTLLTSGTRDLFLSNTVRMHRALRAAGIEAELHVLEAAPHAAFMGMAPEDAEVDADIRAFIDRHCPA